MPRSATKPYPNKPANIPKCLCDKAGQICRKCLTSIRKEEESSNHCKQCICARMLKLEKFYDSVKHQETEKLKKQKADRKMLKKIEDLETFGDTKMNVTTQPKFTKSNQKKTQSFNIGSKKPKIIRRISNSQSTRHPSGETAYTDSDGQIENFNEYTDRETVPDWRDDPFYLHLVLSRI